jgi:hypothetical protein
MADVTRVIEQTSVWRKTGDSRSISKATVQVLTPDYPQRTEYLPTQRWWDNILPLTDEHHCAACEAA